MKIKGMLQDRVLVKAIDEATKTKAGILLPKALKEDTFEAEVMLVGPGTLESPITLKKGDKVLCGRNMGIPYKEQEDDLEIHYVLTRQPDIIAIL